MSDRDWLAEEFEQHRPQLRTSPIGCSARSSEADDAVQEAWLRLDRADAERRREPRRGWLTTVVARVCLDMLRARTSRRDEAAARGCPSRS